MTERQTIFQPYPRRYPALVKVLYRALQDGVINRALFAACLATVMGEHR